MVAWLECTLAENAGGPLHIGFHLEPGYSVANCLASHDELRLRDVLTETACVYLTAHSVGARADTPGTTRACPALRPRAMCCRRGRPPVRNEPRRLQRPHDLGQASCDGQLLDTAKSDRLLSCTVCTPLLSSCAITLTNTLLPDAELNPATVPPNGTKFRLSTWGGTGSRMMSS